MDTSTERHLKTGGDPRLLPDYAALREELGKLTHPARPDVDWRRVEQLSLSLFERNGVELQTVAWYMQARLRLLGLMKGWRSSRRSSRASGATCGRSRYTREWKF